MMNLMHDYLKFFICIWMDFVSDQFGYILNIIYVKLGMVRK